ncbi:MAG: hypothetical protein RR278_05785 [Mucinivorans sp.]
MKTINKHSLGVGVAFRMLVVATMLCATACVKQHSIDDQSGAMVPIELNFGARASETTADVEIYSVRVFVTNDTRVLTNHYQTKINPVAFTTISGSRNLYVLLNEPSAMKSKLDAITSVAELQNLKIPRGQLVAKLESGTETEYYVAYGELKNQIINSKHDQTSPQKFSISTRRLAIKVDLTLTIVSEEKPTQIVFSGLPSQVPMMEIDTIGESWVKENHVISNPVFTAASAADQTAGYKYTYTQGGIVLPSYVFSPSTDENRAVKLEMRLVGRTLKSSIGHEIKTAPYDYTLHRNNIYRLNARSSSQELSITTTVLPWDLEVVNGNIHTYGVNDLANCYIVAPSAADTRNVLEFPVAQVNQCDQVPHIANGDALTAKLVWTDMAGAGNVALADDAALASVNLLGNGPTAKIRVVAGSKEGNAVVGIYRGADLMWSWHIWVTKYNPDLAKNQLTKTNSMLTFMNRALGSREITFAGLYYQWGRKDPFVKPDNVAPFNAPANVVDQAGVHVPQSMSASGPSTIAAAVRNASTFMVAADPLSKNWVNREDKTLWGWSNGSGTKKTVYDPCPIGWRVPSAEEYGENFRPESVVSGFFIKNLDAWFDFTITNNPMWTASPAMSSNISEPDGSALMFKADVVGSSNTWNQSNVGSRVMAMNIRCVRDLVAPSLGSLTFDFQKNGGAINTYSGEAAERSRLTFKTQMTNEGGTRKTYKWMVNGKLVTQSGKDYVHTVTRYTDQSFYLQGQVSDELGRTAQTAKILVVAKRPFNNDLSSPVTMQNCDRYLVREKEKIAVYGGSRVRYLRDERDNNIYRVKLMSQGRWWMVSEMRYFIPGATSSPATTDPFVYENYNLVPEGVCLYKAASLYGASGNSAQCQGICPLGWYIPTEEDLLRLFPGVTTTPSVSMPDNGKNLEGQDETNQMHFEGSGMGYGTGNNSPIYTHYWLSGTGSVVNYLRYGSSTTGENYTFSFVRTASVRDRFALRCIKK